MRNANVRNDLNRLKDRLNDEEIPVEKFWLKESIQSMRLKIESLKTLDDQMIELIASETTEGVEKRIEKEIENSDSVRAELNDIVMRMEEMMSKCESPPSIVQPSTARPPKFIQTWRQEFLSKARQKQDFQNLK